MKDKHLHIAADSALLKTIYRTVDRELQVNRRGTAVLLVIKFVFYLALTASLYLLLYKAANPIYFLACYAGFGLASVLFCFNFAHDFSHHTVFKSRRADQLGFVLLYTLVGAHAEAWKHRHVHAHHYAPNVEGYDSDLSISSLIRVSPGGKRISWHRYQHLYAPLAYTTYSLFWVFVKDFVLLMSKEGPRKSPGYYLSFWVQKLAYLTYILILPLAISGQPPLLVVAGFLLMHALQSLFLLFTFFMTHHVEATAYPTTDAQGYILESWLMNQVKSSNDFYPFSPAANFLFGGFNNHIAHHLFPHVHHVHYPQLNRILFPLLEAHGIRPNVTTYFGGIRSHLRLLRKMGQA